MHWGEWVSEAVNAPAPAASCATRTQHATVSGCLSCTYRRETNLARTSYDTTTNADTTRDKPFYFNFDTDPCCRKFFAISLDFYAYFASGAENATGLIKT